MVLKVIFLFIFLSINTSYSHVFNPAYYGEKSFDIYYGPSYPKKVHNEYFNSLIWDDDIKANSFIESFLDSGLLKLLHLVNHDFESSYVCSHYKMSRDYESYQYAYRLINLSYLFELFFEYELEFKRLGLKNTCFSNFQEIVNQVQTTSVRMNKLKERTHMFLERVSLPKISYEHKSNEHFNKILNLLTEPAHSNLIASRLKLMCQKNCNLTKKDFEALMLNTCKSDIALFKQIFEEKDSLYGMSNAGIPYFLLMGSNILRPIDQAEQGVSCLRRFSIQFSSKEKRNIGLEQLFPLIHNEVLSRDKTVPEGRFFAMGALEEFEQKGITAIFTKPDKVASKPELPDEPIIFDTRSVTEIKKTIPKPKKKPTVIVTKAKVSPPARRYSSFYQAAKKLEENNLKQISIDMKLFKYDYMFTLKTLDILRKTLPQYTSRVALAEMKKFDKLGKEAGPVPLIFIKYLIEMQDHQALYNILDVVGEVFYVKNDIDEGVKQIVKIQLLNNNATNFEWTIILLP
jgi:hypothetical protein